MKLLKHLPILPVLLLSTPALATSSSSPISPTLFYDLEEYSRIVDISYCVGLTGISQPFTCASRCAEFPTFELLQTFNTGLLQSDSCGYIALSHPPAAKRIIVAFRGTYSIANTIADLSTIPQKYTPYPGSPPPDSDDGTNLTVLDEPCANCTVHAGFLRSWQNTRTAILPALKKAIASHPDYQLSLVGHSLGGAVASLAALEFVSRGWRPLVTTFGEPRVGNEALMNYFDTRFTTESNRTVPTGSKHPPGHYRRVTHASDPVPLLPPGEWGFRMHKGEIFIGKVDLKPEVKDLRLCTGDADRGCIAGEEAEGGDVGARFWGEEWMKAREEEALLSRKRAVEAQEDEISPDLDPDSEEEGELEDEAKAMWGIPPRFRGWQLFWAHRDYFWRIGLCVPGGDPKNWFGGYPGEEGPNGRVEL